MKKVVWVAFLGCFFFNSVYAFNLLDKLQRARHSSSHHHFLKSRQKVNHAEGMNAFYGQWEGSCIYEGLSHKETLAIRGNELHFSGETIHINGLNSLSEATEYGTDYIHTKALA